MANEERVQEESLPQFLSGKDPLFIEAVFPSPHPTPYMQMGSSRSSPRGS